MARVQDLTNKQGDIIYPKTVTSAVYDEDGTRLDMKLDQDKQSVETRLGEVNQALDAKATTATYTVTLSTEWSGSAAPYMQTVTVTGMLATDAPFVDVVLPDDWAAAEAMIEDWGKMARVVSGDGSVTFYATDKTSTAMTVQLKVVR